MYISKNNTNAAVRISSYIHRQITWVFVHAYNRSVFHYWTRYFQKERRDIFGDGALPPSSQRVTRVCIGSSEGQTPAMLGRLQATNSPPP